MERADIVLGVLAAGEGTAHTPVQVQKLFFLIDKRLGKRISGPFFAFKPYFYGPFDRQVYVELEDLAKKGLVEVCFDGARRTYRLTEAGQQKGRGILATLPEEIASFIENLSSTLRQMSFGELVSAIYRAYPEMRANSVFQASE